jgi:DNA-3-methyladenine glycosylase II
MPAFDKNNFQSTCDILASRDSALNKILKTYGYPPYWVRPNSFETLLLIILEQQVSIAAAYAAYMKLKQRIGKILPQKILQLTDVELRACYFSRQKIIYARELAIAVITKQIVLKKFVFLSGQIIRGKLKQLKGIGDWTVDIYLIHALRRSDVLPLGDLALVNAIKMIKENNTITKEEIVQFSEHWIPYRSIATMILWHYYIQKKNIKLIH